MLHEVLQQMHKDVAESNAIHRPHAQEIHNGGTNGLHFNNATGDYAMICAHEQKEHKLQTKLKGPMRVKEAK